MKKSALLLLLITVLLCTLVFFAACGEDKKPQEASTTQTTAASTTPATDTPSTTGTNVTTTGTTTLPTSQTNPLNTTPNTPNTTGTPSLTTAPLTTSLPSVSVPTTTVTTPPVSTPATTTAGTSVTTPNTTLPKPVVTTPTTTTQTQPIVTTPTVTTTAKPIVTTSAPITTTVPETTKPAEPEIPEPPLGTRILVKYEINNPYAGSLSGTASQFVNYGQSKTKPVSITTNLGYKFVGWSDGKTTTSREGDCPRENTTYTAIFEFDALELPILDLYTDNGQDITDKYNYVTGKISVHNAPEGFNFEDLAMEIRGRGNYTWGSTFNADPMYNKRPYRIKLSEKMNLLGQGDGKAKNWVLIANHCDQSLLRNQTVMQFAKMMTGIVWEPSTSSVEVFLNGNYIGVYVLTEQVQINKNRIDLSEDITTEEVDFLLHRSGYAYNEAENISFSYDGQPYEVVSDLSTDPILYAKQFEYIQGRIRECWDAIKRGNKQEVMALMDINSVIDTLIVHEYFKNLDTGHDNFYMFASTDSKLFFGPVWDFDQCAGNADVGVENYEGIRGSFENKWYDNLLKHDWFKEMLRDRWDELYETELKAVPDKIRTQAKAAYNSYCRNFEKWKILGYTDERGNKQLGYKINRELEHIRIFQTYDEHYEYFAYWMEQRLVWLNNYYHSPQFLMEKVKLELTGEGTESSPYLITSAKDFYNFTMVMASGETFQGKYIKQTANIDMTSVSFYSGVANPNVFAGTYDGAGHTIHANITSTESSFFPYLKGTVMNLVTTGSVKNSGHAGGICRSVRVGGMIVNCGTTVTLSSAGGNVGGIAPSNEGGGGSVIGCWFAGKIIGGNSYGPIIVYMDGRNTGTIKDNYYVSDYLAFDTQAQPATRVENETPKTPDEFASLHTTLNADLQTVASLAKLNKNQLCMWRVQNKLPSPIEMK